MTATAGVQPGWRRPARATQVPSAGSAHGIAFYALLVFTFVLVVAPQSHVPALAPLHPAFVAALVAAGAWLCAWIGGGPTVWTAETRLAALLLVWALATAPLSIWPSGSILFLCDTYAKTLMIFWLLCQTVTSPARLRRVFWALTLMSIPVSVTAVWHLAAGVLIPGSGRGSVARIIGYQAPLTANPNDLALTLNLILPLVLSLLLTSSRPAVRAALMVVLVLAAFAVVSTYSRGGFITLAVTAVLGLWRLGRRSGRGMVMAVVAVLLALGIALLLPQGYVAHLGTLLDMDRDTTGSAQGRWTGLVAAAAVVLEHPVAGSGAGMNALALNEVHGPRWLKVHNVYLELAAELGIPGLVLFLLLQRRASDSARLAAAARPETAILAEGIRLSLTAFAVAALFHPVAYQFYFYYFAALAVAVHRMAATGGAGPLPRTVTRRPVSRRLSPSPVRGAEAVLP